MSRVLVALRFCMLSGLNENWNNKWNNIACCNAHYCHVHTRVIVLYFANNKSAGNAVSITGFSFERH